MKMIDRIVNLLRERGLAYHDLEAKVALPRNRVSKWVQGQGEPTARQALRIARELGVPLEWLVDDRSGERPEPQFSEEEMRCLWALRAMGIAPGEALKRVELAGRLMAEPRRVPAPSATKAAPHRPHGDIAGHPVPAPSESDAANGQPKRGGRKG